jgi:hypothetical protein
MNVLKEHVCVCEKCEIDANKPIFVAPGNVSEYRLTNESKKKVSKYIVDDCLLKTKERHEKCDYLFVVKEIRETFFVECKGSDVLKAVSQIDSSLDILIGEFKGYVSKARIVPSRVYGPDLRNIKYKKLRERLKGHLDTKNKIYQETI